MGKLKMNKRILIQIILSILCLVVVGVDSVLNEISKMDIVLIIIIVISLIVQIGAFIFDIKNK